jgi:pimeloyl-ACP methyl ester carboxylesterase
MKDSSHPPIPPQVSGMGASEIRSADAGAGKPVLVLQANLKNSLVDQLARHFRVITCAPSTAPLEPAGAAKAVAETADRLGVTRYCLIGEAELAAGAIAHTIDFADRVEALILVAPTTSLTAGGETTAGAGAGLRLEDIQVPTLVLFGTRDETGCEAGRSYARRIASCFYTLVYDSGRDIAGDRPQALYAVVRDFLEHRERFVLGQESSALNP